MEKMTIETRATQETNRKLENLIRISVETYHQMATLTLLLARESDLRTGGARIATLTKELEQKNIFLEYVVPAAISGVCYVASRVLLSNAVLLEKLDDFARAVFSLQEPISNQPELVWGIAIILTLVVFFGIQKGLGWYGGKSKMAKLVVKGLQKLTDLYVPHSALNGRIQEARQLRVRTEAKMHQYLGLTWQEIEASGGTQEMRGHVDAIAGSDLQRALDEAEYEAAGGDYWLEMLRAGLRGEIPAFICLYVDEAWKNRGKKSEEVAKEVSRWRKEAILSCKAETKVIGEDSPEKKEVYQDMINTLKTIDSFSVEGLDRLLRVWRKEHPGLGLRAGDHRKGFESHFEKPKPEY